MGDSTTALKYDALTRELERMRNLQQSYFSRFFSWIVLTGFTFVLLYLLPFPEAHALLPFFVVTAGVQASFYLHFVDFARTHAAGLEGHLNRLLGEKLLLGSILEDAYLYPHDQPKFSGIVLGELSRFFSAYTAHWLFLWAFFYSFGVLSAWPVLQEYRTFYLVLLATWTALNLGYLTWYFLRRRDLDQVAHLIKYEMGAPLE